MMLVREIAVFLWRLANFTTTYLAMCLACFGALALYAIRSPEQIILTDVGPLLLEAADNPYPIFLIITMSFGISIIVTQRPPFRLPERWATVIDSRTNRMADHLESRIKAIFNKP
jgi:hypothetical protein